MPERTARDAERIDLNGETGGGLERAGELLREQRAAEAERLLAAFIERSPASAPAWFMTGVARHLQQRAEAALAAMEAALEIDPTLDEARRAAATLLFGLKRPREALAHIETLLRRRPASADFLADAGIVLEALGEDAAALERYDAALRLAPQDFRARLNRGVLLARLGRLDAALRDQQELVRRYIGSAPAHYNLGDLLLRMDRYAEALAAAGRALALAPRDARARMLRGLALAMLGRDDEARASFAEARAADAAAAEGYLANAARAAGLAPSARLTLDPRQIRLARLLERQKQCDWGPRPQLVEGLRALAAELRARPFPIEEPGLYHTALSLPLSAADQKALADGIALAARARAGNPLALPVRQHRDRIRLGFVSADFREHPAAQLHWRQLAGHDRERFEVFAYSLHPGEGPARERIVAACDRFAEVSELGDREIALRIAADGIDILIDLSGHLEHARPDVLALRPAPLRVSYLGFPATLGEGLADYRIADAATTPPEPEASACWSERLVLLPDTLFIYDDRQPIAEKIPARADLGLPEAGFVFCCFNTPYKIEPDVFAVWMRLLSAVPASVLWLIDGGAAARDNLRREAAARGIDPARLVFAPRLPRDEHLARHACADLFIDTFHCGAHTTAADALWAGLPVLGVRGPTMAASIGASIVRAAGLAELVVADHAAYEAAALRLATRPEELAALRARLAENRLRCPLFDTAGRVRELDCAFETMWQRHRAGLPPESFAVPPDPYGKTRS